MQQRESHKKSRRGCQSCKKRHVKCDEQGPPCANCVVRKLQCVYQPTSTLSTKKKGTLASRPKKLKPALTNSREGSSQGPSDTLEVSSTPTQTISLSPTPSPVSFSSTVQEERLLELELMHRWSTRTFSGLCSVPEDVYYLQTYLPQSSLHTSYLLHGILALSSLDLALSGPPAMKSKYLRTALQYCNKATSEFRIQLQDIKQDNLHLLYYFATLAAVFNFTTSCEGGTLERMDSAFEMLIGASMIGMVNLEWLLESPCSARSVIFEIRAEMSRGGDYLDRIDSDSRRALECISSVWNHISNSNPSKASQEGEKYTPLYTEEDKTFYPLIIQQMRFCFAEDARDKIKFFCFGWVSMAGTGFLQRTKRREPMALYLEMYFGVLLDRASRDPLAWWVGGSGREIVNCISGLLMGSDVASLPEGWEGICWARREVGLLDLLVES